MKIIVTGSLGNISQPLTQELVQKGHEVVVISSSASKQQGIEALGATAAIGSLDDSQFLTATFTGADAVYAMIPPNFAAPDMLAHYETIGQSYAEAITASGVKRVVQLSSWGAHLPQGTGFIVGSYRVEQILNRLQGVSITYLRPASFYYNLFHYIDMIKHAGFIGTNFGGSDSVAMVSPLDIAAAAAEELELLPAANTIRYVASDERTCNETAAILGAAIGIPDLKWIMLPEEQVKQAMMNNHMPEHVADKFVELNASIHSGLLREDYDLHKPIPGKVKLEDFAKEFAQAFKEKK
jgi:uncharacterized protein YbjT (DUF2867 family)